MNYLLKPCAPGFYSLEGEVECSECPLGYSCEANGEPPRECQDGTYNSVGYKCRVCPRGFECLKKDEEPKECPDLTYSLEGEMRCLPCPEGTYCVFKDRAPSICEDGTENCITRATIFVSLGSN